MIHYSGYLTEYLKLIKISKFISQNHKFSLLIWVAFVSFKIRWSIYCRVITLMLSLYRWWRCVLLKNSAFCCFKVIVSEHKINTKCLFWCSVYWGCVKLATLMYVATKVFGNCASYFCLIPYVKNSATNMHQMLMFSV